MFENYQKRKKNECKQHIPTIDAKEKINGFIWKVMRQLKESEEGTKS